MLNITRSTSVVCRTVCACSAVALLPKPQVPRVGLPNYRHAVRPIGGGVREQGPGFGARARGFRGGRWEVGNRKPDSAAECLVGGWVGTRRWSPGLSGRRGGRLGAALNWAEAGTEDRSPACRRPLACILASMSCHSGPGSRKGPFPGRTGLIDPGSNRDTFAYISKGHRRYDRAGGCGNGQ